MGRIEDIRRIVRETEESLYDEHDLPGLFAELKEVLSHLQIAEQALEKISAHESYPVGIALQALEQIRRD